MHDQKNLRAWVIGFIVIALFFAYAVPRYLSSRTTIAGAAPNATVPGQLLTPDQNGSVPSQSPQATPTHLAVYVCGDVRRPGVYNFTAGVRVADGIARAGGALPDADLEQLNLAEPLIDAMKIDVPKKGQIIAAAFSADATSTTSSHGTRRHSSHHGGSSHKLQPGQTLNVNTATESELTALPGVGPGIARRIVEYRTANGPFQTVDDLQNVSGIGPSKFEKMSAYIRL